LPRYLGRRKFESIVLLRLSDLPAAREYYRIGAWTDETFHAALARHAAQRPEAHALRDARLP